MIPWLFGVLIVVSAGLLFIDVPVVDALFVAGFGALGLLILYLSHSPFAEAVLDGGDFLRIRDRGIEEDIPLHEIEAVKEPLWRRRPARIELVLRAPGKLGRVIAFVPIESSLIPFQKSALTIELEERVARAQRELR